MKLKPTAQIVDDITQVHPSPMSGTATSSPIPVLDGGRLRIVFFQYSAGYDVANNGMGMDAPDRVVYYDPETGTRLREEPLERAPTLGTERFDLPLPEYLNLRAQLYDAYDTLLPAFMRGDKNPSPEVRAAAETYARIFPRFSGKLLKPYYDRIGKDWFSWLDTITHSSPRP